MQPLTSGRIYHLHGSISSHHGSTCRHRKQEAHRADPRRLLNVHRPVPGPTPSTHLVIQKCPHMGSLGPGSWQLGSQSWTCWTWAWVAEPGFQPLCSLPSCPPTSAHGDSGSFRGGERWPVPSNLASPLDISKWQLACFPPPLTEGRTRLWNS